MALLLKPAGEHPAHLVRASSPAAHDIDRQRLQILRCTAQAMASTPGGLRFKAGTRPWLEGLSAGLSASGRRNGRGTGASARPVGS